METPEAQLLTESGVGRELDGMAATVCSVFCQEMTVCNRTQASGGALTWEEQGPRCHPQHQLDKG